MEDIIYICTCDRELNTDYQADSALYTGFWYQGRGCWGKFGYAIRSVEMINLWLSRYCPLFHKLYLNYRLSSAPLCHNDGWRCELWGQVNNGDVNIRTPVGHTGGSHSRGAVTHTGNIELQKEKAKSWLHQWFKTCCLLLEWLIRVTCYKPGVAAVI